MALLLTLLWPALAAAFLLGGLVGAFAGLPRDRGTAAAGAILGAMTTVLCGFAVTGPVGGRTGLWIEIAAFCLVAYLIGCLAGAVARRQPRT
ncbi:hypothetical protein [uncultured Methylobacterium sp.]|uniref:hypothetical protein n=1 Tax=uncultured Methylobacterium sp. TaxID=157278 RepID=UPI0035CA9D75